MRLRQASSGNSPQSSAPVIGALRVAAFIDRAFVVMCTIGRFPLVSALFSPARLRLGVARDAPQLAEPCPRPPRSMSRRRSLDRGARELDRRDQPPLPGRVAVDIALGDLYRLVTGQQLNVAQAAASLARVSRRPECDEQPSNSNLANRAANQSTMLFGRMRPPRAERITGPGGANARLRATSARPRLGCTAGCADRRASWRSRRRQPSNRRRARARRAPSTNRGRRSHRRAGRLPTTSRRFAPAP
jgi:hypothetical protein